MKINVFLNGKHIDRLKVLNGFNEKDTLARARINLIDLHGYSPSIIVSRDRDTLGPVPPENEPEFVKQRKLKSESPKD